MQCEGSWNWNLSPLRLLCQSCLSGHATIAAGNFSGIPDSGKRLSPIINSSSLLLFWFQASRGFFSWSYYITVLTGLPATIYLPPPGFFPRCYQSDLPRVQICVYHPSQNSPMDPHLLQWKFKFLCILYRILHSFPILFHLFLPSDPNNLIPTQHPLPLSLFLLFTCPWRSCLSGRIQQILLVWKKKKERLNKGRDEWKTLS